MMPEEWGRLQGFVGYAFMDKNGEDQFSFPSGLSDAQKYKQFGNSVTIPVIKSMAEFMLKCFDEMRPTEWENRVLGFVGKCKSTTRNQLAEFLGIGKDECSMLIKRLIDEKKLFQNGSRRGTFYTLWPGVYTEPAKSQNR